MMMMIVRYGGGGGVYDVQCTAMYILFAEQPIFLCRLQDMRQQMNTTKLPIAQQILLKAQKCESDRGLFSLFYREKPPNRKLLFWANFIENWAPRKQSLQAKSQKVRKCS